MDWRRWDPARQWERLDPADRLFIAVFTAATIMMGALILGLFLNTV